MAFTEQAVKGCQHTSHDLTDHSTEEHVAGPSFYTSDFCHHKKRD